MSRNRLSEETSPYLLQHKDNPVHWYAWGEDAFKTAREENKPILLSVGYAACHWCHVMAHESFENDAIAGVMNDHFVNVKVDREERPDIDAIYQSALAATGEQGGWPLTMFLNPDGKPFWGGTYFPPEPRYGRPGFPDLLLGVSKAFQDQAPSVADNTRILGDALTRIAAAKVESGSLSGIDDVVTAAKAAMAYIDPVHGGTHGAPKFPQPTLFELLWRGYKRSKDLELKKAVVHSLTQMCQGGIYDHLGGGFARYSTDHQWLVPHFEKMLYDNALLLKLLTWVWQDTKEPLFAERAEETAAWMIRDLFDDHPEKDGTGAFVSSFDADSEGVEGKFYVWSEEEIDAVLGDAAGDFKRAYGVTKNGNWEGTNILNRSADALGSEAWESKLKTARDLLLAERSKRIPPGRDDKILADWNGLAIAALAEASKVFGWDERFNLAEQAFAFVTQHMTQPDGRLLHSWCDGTARHPATLEDYANMSLAGLALFERTGDKAYLVQVEKWTNIIDAHYHDKEDGGYFLAADDTPHLVVRTKPISDNATPPGNGILVEVFAKLHHLTGKTAYRDKADEILKTFVLPKPEHRFSQSSLISGYDTLADPVSVVLIGESKTLSEAVLSRSLPNLVLSKNADPQTLPEDHPAFGKSTVDDKPTAYVCRDGTCGLPITDEKALSEALASL